QGSSSARCAAINHRNSPSAPCPDTTQQPSCFSTGGGNLRSQHLPRTLAGRTSGVRAGDQSCATLGLARALRRREHLIPHRQPCRNPGCNQEKLPSESLSKPEQTWLDRPLTRLDAAAPVFCAPRPGEDQSFVVGDSCLSCFSTNAHAPLSHNEPLRPTTDPGICRWGWKGPT
uniref:Uncharacterized protein n=1 Tax=Chlorocebus sabaeus TaxID=60711 RepID=A0A0D9RGB8_CHLSB